MDRDSFFEQIHDVKMKLAHMREKLTGHDQDKKKTDQDKIELEEELRFYQKEHPVGPQERVLKDHGGQDISAI